MSHRYRQLVVSLIAATTLVMTSATSASAGPVTQKAVDWLATQQLADGGFDAQFGPTPSDFDTSDATLAIAENAQTPGAAWSPPAALAAVQNFKNGSGKNPLLHIDIVAEQTPAPSPGKAAKLIVQVAAPLGFDPVHFDAAGDGGEVNLVQLMDGGAGADGSFGPRSQFTNTLYAAIAERLIGRPVSASTVRFITSGQQANGGFTFDGDPTGAQLDPDETGLAVEALMAAGLSPTDEPVRRAVQLLASMQQPSGQWADAFSSTDNPNSTAVAMQGLAAAGEDVDSACYRAASPPGAGASIFRRPAEALAALQQPDGRIPGSFDDVFATAQAVQALLRQWLPVGRAGLRHCPDAAYRMAASDGGVFVFGSGDAFAGSMGGRPLNQPVVGMTSTPSGLGYWLVARDGGVFAFGDAGFFGSMGGQPLNQPVVGMASTPSGLGYWLVAADGGIFAFGDAAFYGSTGSIHLNRPVVGMAASGTGLGYWLVASDGGVFNYGDAGFAGSAGSIQLAEPVVGIAARPDRQGYWLAGADGGVFAYGTARFLGSAAGGTTAPVVGIKGSRNGQGYTLAGADGRTYPMGAALQYGKPASVAKPVVGIAS